MKSTLSLFVALVVLLCAGTAVIGQISPLIVQFSPTQVPNYPAGTYWYTGGTCFLACVNVCGDREFPYLNLNFPI